jgi:Tfp pilus assembly protein PilE
LESIVVAIITGIVTLVGVIMSNSKSRAVMEVKIDALTQKVEKHNQLIERTYELERSMAVVRNDVESLKGKADRNG